MLAASPIVLDLSATADHGLATHRIVPACADAASDDGQSRSVVVLDTAAPDTSDARMQLREVMDNMLVDAVNATQTAARPKTQSHVLMPDRGLVSIQQLIAQLNHLAPGEKPSADRLARIAQHTSRSQPGQSSNVLEVRHLSVVMQSSWSCAA